MNCCFLKKNKVSPRLNIDEPPIKQGQLLEEVIPCGFCKQLFTLKDDKIVGCCSGCYKFMHCGIAGSCIGPNCTHVINGEVYRQSWCIACVPKTVIINLENMGKNKDCLCQECLDDPKTPNAYKKKI